MIGIGEYLRQAREAKGLSLEDVQEATKIRRKYVAALEEERWDDLPSAVYARGFLRLYARLLGLDAEALVSFYPSQPEPPSPPPRAPVSGRRRRWLVIGLMIVLAAATVWLYSQREESSPFSGPTGVRVVIPTITPTPIVAILSPEPLTTTITPTPTAIPTPALVGLVQMPPVGSRSYDDAKARLEALGLVVVRQDSPSSEVPLGVVFGQSPAPGQEVERGQTATLRVSAGAETTVVPDVKGKSEKEARQELVAAGLVVDPWVNYLQGPEVSWTCVGCVLSITPGEGSIVSRGSTVALAVREN